MHPPRASRAGANRAASRRRSRARYRPDALIFSSVLEARRLLDGSAPTATILNASATMEGLSPQSGRTLPGVPLNLRIGVNDPDSGNSGAEFTFNIDWGDGSPIEVVNSAVFNPPTPSTWFAHAYAQVGSYAVRVTVADPEANVSQTVSTTALVSDVILIANSSVGSVVFAAGTPGDDSFVIDAHSPTTLRVTRNGEVLGFSDGYVEIHAGGGDDTILVDANVRPFSSSITFDGGEGADRSTFNMRELNNEFRVYLRDTGSSGTDEVVFNGTDGPESFGFYGQYILGLGGGVDYLVVLDGGVEGDIVESLTFDSRGGNDTLFGGYSLGHTYTLLGGEGDDLIYAGLVSESVFIDGGEGSDVLGVEFGGDGVATVTDMGVIGVDRLEIYGDASSEILAISATQATWAAGQIAYDPSVESIAVVLEYGGDDSVAVVATSIPLAIDAGEGSDNVTIQLGSLAGAVTIVDSGLEGNDSLIAVGTSGPDYIDKRGSRITLDDPATETIDYAGIEQVTIQGGSGNDTIIDPGADTTILGGEGDDTIVITATSTGTISIDGGDGSDILRVILGSLEGAVLVGDTGATGTDSLVVEGTATGGAVTVESGRITSGSEVVQYAPTLTSLTVAPGAGDSSVTIASVGAAGVTIDAGSGATDVTVRLGGLAGPVVVAGSATSGVVSVAVLGAPGDNVIAVSGKEITSGSESVVLDTPLAGLSVAGASGTTEITVTALTVAVDALDLIGGDSANSFTLVDMGDAPVGAIAVQGGPDPNANVVQVVGSPPPVVTYQNFPPAIAGIPDAVVIEGSRLALSGSFADPDAGDSWTATVDYGDGAGAVPLVLAADKTFGLDHLYATRGDFVTTVTISDLGGGVTRRSFPVTVRNAAPVASALGPTSGVRGQTRHFLLAGSDVSPADSAAGFTYIVDWGDGAAGRTIAATAGNGDGVAVDHVFTEAGTYTLQVTAIDRDGAASAALSFTINIAVAELQADPLDPSRTVLVVGGTTADDDLKIKPGQAEGEVYVVIREEEHKLFYRRTFDPTIHRIVVYGQAGDDDIVVKSGVNITSWLFGDAGNDRLKGGRGNDVLMGGDGDDLLSGNGGLDILIGGQGSDKIVGSGGDDLLISGAIAFEVQDLALAAIQAEWTSARTYAQRVANLRGTGTGSRANGQVFLTTEGGRPAVIDDGSRDVLTGDTGRDWFFFNIDGEEAEKDVATDLSAVEFRDDLDFIDG